MSEKGKEMVVFEKEMKKGKMREKGKGIEGDEREMVDHWSHEHPLTLVDTREREYCYGCELRFGSGEKAYGCSMKVCRYAKLLHEECAAMAREIRHPLHHLHPQAQHILIQQHQPHFDICDICQQTIRSIVYRCSFRGYGDEQMANIDIIQHHPSHPDHELKLLQRRSIFECNACNTIHSGSWYMCTTDGCGYRIHRRCASLPQTIKREDHPHSLFLSYHVPLEYRYRGIRYEYKCNVCSTSFLPECWIYHCQICMYIVHITCAFKEPLCGFNIHLRCAQGGGVIDDEDQRRSVIHHPSHPGHELKLLRRECSFKCDACRIKGSSSSSYTCTNDDCQYWIHEKCATLPQSFKREDHHHSLSLSFEVPFEYLKFNYKCDVCNTILVVNYWIYHCQICRFIVHVKCAFNKPPPRITLDIGRVIIRLPTSEVAEELITPFVMREKGTFMPNDDGDESVNVRYYKFIHHQHQLTLVSSGDRSQEEEEEEDEENYGVRWELICDGCITPISSSYYYMSCGECRYNLHIACFNLPPQLSSLPPHHQRDDHHLLLQSCDKLLQPWNRQYCSVCYYDINGLFYGCGECGFKVDIKCACMPYTILHAAHPQHLLNHVARDDLWSDRDNSLRLLCASCDAYAFYYDCYRCCNSSCDFIVHLRCALLPASVSSRRWDSRHPLLLMYDATLNRPGDFYCDQCETQMNPRSWMYRCRACDVSFHPKCFPTTSGGYRNIKLGQECHVNAETHPHTLTFQLLTTKRRCDICRSDKYEQQGFYCALCNFFICLYWCGKNMIAKGDLKAVDLEKLSVLDH
ncbi:uncharacterized protein LOC125204921 [Salvia hispanica]|uniref:uncharacterized protein LOC125204921 n=1 Tax=Salvia hispanica TaxID=49212 RepID=UPI0020093315|nr:uncharacterized protein LOC125204921 [Salvia hispanica]